MGKSLAWALQTWFGRMNSLDADVLREGRSVPQGLHFDYEGDGASVFAGSKLGSNFCSRELELAQEWIFIFASVLENTPPETIVWYPMIQFCGPFFGGFFWILLFPKIHGPTDWRNLCDQTKTLCHSDDLWIVTWHRGFQCETIAFPAQLRRSLNAHMDPTTNKPTRPKTNHLIKN